jgi:hypothetical protein
VNVDDATIAAWSKLAEAFDVEQMKRASFEEACEGMACSFLEAGFAVPSMVAKMRPLLAGKAHGSLVVRLACPDVVEVEHWVKVATRYALSGQGALGRRIADARRAGHVVLVVERPGRSSVEAVGVEGVLRMLGRVAELMVKATNGGILQ